MGKKKKRHIWPLILLLILAGLGAAYWFYVRPMLEEAVSAGPAYNEYTVRSGSVSVTVTGSGILESADETLVKVPGGLKIATVEKKTGDTVLAGEALYTLDTDALTEQIFALRKEVEGYARTVASRSASDSLYCMVKGKLKAVYAAAGDRVEDVMQAHGALAVISTDDRMAVSVPVLLAPGAAVKVSFTQGGKEYTEDGTVLLCADGASIVTISDKTALPGETAVVSDGSGLLGSGPLYVHAPVPVYGTEGLIKSVDAKVNATVTYTTKLLTLNGDESSVSYQEALHAREKAAARLSEALNVQNDPVIRAAEDGTVYSLLVSEGSVTQEDSPVAVLHTGGVVKMRVDIDETDIPSIALGQTVSVTPDAFPEESFPGTVTRLSGIGKQSGSITVYEAELTLEGDGCLLEGMHGSAVITTDTRENAVTVPVAVLSEDEEGTFVLLSSPEGPVKWFVTTGISDGTVCEITEGLSDGDTILYTDRGATDIISKMMATRNAMMRSARGGKK